MPPLAAQSLPPLDLTDSTHSRVWRVELRLGRTALRNRADIRGWGSFYARLQREMEQLSQDLSLHIPTGDSNRSRWPLHPLWRMVQDTIAERMFQHDARVPPEVVRQIDLEEKQRDLLKLLAAHSVTLAYLDGKSAPDYAAFSETLPVLMQRYLDQHPRGIEERLAEAAVKYGELMGD